MLGKICRLILQIVLWHCLDGRRQRNRREASFSSCYVDIPHEVMYLIRAGNTLLWGNQMKNFGSLVSEVHGTVRDDGGILNLS
jgi:hypothetical protein